MRKKLTINLKIIISWIVGIIFIWSSLAKLSAPREFAIIIENYQVFGKLLSVWGAILIPALEFIVGLMLILGIWVKEAWIITVLLYLVFDIMLVQAYIRGLDISCGCFNLSESSPIGFWKILENFILTSLAFWGGILFLRPNSLKKKSFSNKY